MVGGRSHKNIFPDLKTLFIWQRNAFITLWYTL